MKKKFPKPHNSLSFKLNLNYYSTINQPFELSNIQDFKLITNYQELLELLKTNKEEIMKFLYFHKSNIHNNILYESFESIKVNYKEENLALSELFYLALLILDNDELVNYEYPIDYIYEINKYQRNIKNEKLKKLMISKIIIHLIKNYKESNEYKSQEESELEMIKEENENIINENINKYKILNLFVINAENIDIIYTTIIIQIIKKGLIEDYEYTYDLIKQLDLESINITEKMFDEIYKILNTEQYYTKYYMISEVNDLINIYKINFNYILLKYILKNNLYIYKCPFLIEARKNIINIINNNLLQLSSINIDFDSNKLEYVINAITDSEYYFNKFLKFKSEHIIEILNYYKKYFFQSKQISISLIEDSIQNKNPNIKGIFIKDLDIAKKMNDRYPIIKYLFNLEIKEKKIPETEKELKKCVEEWENLEKMIKKKKTKKIIKSNKINLINYFNDKNNKDILLKIFEKDAYDSFIEENKKFLDEKKYKDYLEEFNNNNNKNTTKIQTNINPIITTIYSDDNLKIEKYGNNSNTNYIGNLEENQSIFNYKILKNFSKDNKGDNLLKINKGTSEYQILEFIKIISKHNDSADFIKELSNGFYISGNSYNKEKNELFIYNQFCEKIIEIKRLEGVINYVYEINDNKNEDQIEIIICLNKILFNVYINLIENKLYIEGYTGNYYKLFLKMDQNCCIIAGDKGAFYSSLFFKNNSRLKPTVKILEESITGGIKINGKTAAFISNNIIHNGENKLIIYDIESMKIVKKIEGYSFVLSSNGLCLMPREEIESNNKILLCACKNYSNEQKNGILLVNLTFGNIYFYETYNYEVYCFCPIFNFINNKNSIEGDMTIKEKIEIIDTDYFLVGGFDEEKREGIIKLFKISKNNGGKDAKIIFVQDIIIDNNNDFKEFPRNISCITQSKITGNILVSCWDGNVFLFTPPNIDYFLFYDNQKKNNLSLTGITFYENDNFILS